LFSIKDRSFKRFENCRVKLSAKETKWTLLEVRTHPTFLETLISKYDFGPVKLLGLWRNGLVFIEISVSLYAELRYFLLTLIVGLHLFFKPYLEASFRLL